MAETVTITGLAELNNRLKELPVKLQKTIIRKSLGASGAAGVIKKAAIANAPVRTGRLKAAAIVKFLRDKSNDTQSAYIVTFRRGKRAQRVGKKALNRDAFYASWVEFGHRIVPRRRRGGKGRRRGAAATGSVPGRHFLARAFATAGRQALDVFESKLRAGFDAAVK